MIGIGIARVERNGRFQFRDRAVVVASEQIYPAKDHVGHGILLIQGNRLFGCS